MAMTGVGLVVPANIMHEMACINDTTASDIPMQGVVMGLVFAAVAAGLFTVTADLASYSEIQRQWLMNALNSCGYTVSYSGHTLTLKW